MAENLQPIYDSAKSFYGKAEVKREDQSLVLYSYETKVASYNIFTDEFSLHTEHPQWCSNTSLRHIKEFMQQRGLPKMSKSELTKNYGGQR